MQQIPGGYSHTSGIYVCAELMGGFLKKFALMMGPEPIMGKFLEKLPTLGMKNDHFHSKWPNFCPLWVDFPTILHLWWVLFWDWLRRAYTLQVTHLWQFSERVPLRGSVLHGQREAVKYACVYVYVVYSDHINFKWDTSIWLYIQTRKIETIKSDGDLNHVWNFHTSA